MGEDRLFLRRCVCFVCAFKKLDAGARDFPPPVAGGIPRVCVFPAQYRAFLLPLFLS